MHKNKRLNKGVRQKRGKLAIFAPLQKTDYGIHLLSLQTTL